MDTLTLEQSKASWEFGCGKLRAVVSQVYDSVGQPVPAPGPSCIGPGHCGGLGFHHAVGGQLTASGTGRLFVGAKSFNPSAPQPATAWYAETVNANEHSCCFMTSLKK